MLHDPDVYENPMDFNPDRYRGLDLEMQKVTDPAFGFGRRACPGFHFASGTIFAIVATALATCDILPAVDEQGNDIVPEVVYTSGTIVLVTLLFHFGNNRAQYFILASPNRSNAI